MKRYTLHWDMVGESDTGEWVKAEDAIKQHQDDMNELERLSIRVRELETANAGLRELVMRQTMCMPCERAVLDAIADLQPEEVLQLKAVSRYLCNAVLALREAK